MLRSRASQFQKRQKESSKEELLDLAKSHKDQGNESFKAKDFTAAIKNYEQGIDYLENSRDVLLVTLYVNLAQACLNAKQFDKAVKAGTNAIILDEKNVKALYRRSVAYTEQSEFELAKRDLQKVSVFISSISGCSVG